MTSSELPHPNLVPSFSAIHYMAGKDWLLMSLQPLLSNPHLLKLENFLSFLFLLECSLPSALSFEFQLCFDVGKVKQLAPAYNSPYQQGLRNTCSHHYFFFFFFFCLQCFCTVPVLSLSITLFSGLHFHSFSKLIVWIQSH